MGAGLVVFASNRVDPAQGPRMTDQDLRKLAFRFVLTVGIVNLFADMTYEGARANTGPFLGTLGASATIVGFIAGGGELLGYALRSVSGYFADKTHKYWAVIFVGYFINMLARKSPGTSHGSLISPWEPVRASVSGHPSP
jgi:hypothetical protein